MDHHWFFNVKPDLFVVVGCSSVNILVIDPANTVSVMFTAKVYFTRSQLPQHIFGLTITDEFYKVANLHDLCLVFWRITRKVFLWHNKLHIF
ncbi:hypothetical protein FAM18123_02949 [Lacticaseibacillus paracasei]|nr:hypothetical protein FAM18123_02949 [Lacticaseibacillus paracasei]